MHSPDGLSSTLLSQGCIPKVTPRVGTVGETHIPRTGGGVRRLQLAT